MANPVFVIDEDDVERRYICALLAADGFDVLQFERAVEGMVAITVMEPALIILASGPKLASEARSIGIPQLVRVFRRITDAPLAIIGDPKLPDEIDSLVSGGDLFLPRVFGASELISRSRMLIRREGGPAASSREVQDGLTDSTAAYPESIQAILEALSGYVSSKGTRVA